MIKLQKSIMLINMGPVINSTGGVEKVYCDMANELVIRGYNVIAICNENKQGNPAFFLDNRVIFRNINLGDKKTFISNIIRKISRKFKLNINTRFYCNRKVLYRLEKLIEFAKPSLIISFQPKTMYYIKNTNFCNIPVIQMVHGSIDWLNNNLYCKSLIDKVNGAEAVQLLLPSYCEKAREILTTNVVCIPNVVPLVADNQIAKFDNEVNVIVYIARYDISKRQHLLIEAFQLIASKYPKWQVHLYGTEYSVGYVQQMEEYIQKNNLKQQVFFKGKTSNVFGILKKCDICAFPSAAEGFPLALVEAMSAGIPCIGFNTCSGVNELIIDGVNGFLVKENIKDLAEKLIKLIDDKNLRIKMGYEGHLLMKNYSPKKVWAAWQSLINQVIHE